MERLKEYMDHAETCRTLALKTKDPVRKAELLELAAKWSLFLAEERKRLLESRNLSAGTRRFTAGFLPRNSGPRTQDGKK